jgi:hypothetical protein
MLAKGLPCNHTGQVMSLPFRDQTG